MSRNGSCSGCLDASPCRGSAVVGWVSAGSALTTPGANLWMMLILKREARSEMRPSEIKMLRRALILSEGRLDSRSDPSEM